MPRKSLLVIRCCSYFEVWCNYFSEHSLMANNSKKKKRKASKMAAKLKVNNSKSSMPQQLTKMYIFQTVHHRQVM